jgi:nucleoside-diphosphate-sugar epimerase
MGDKHVLPDFLTRARDGIFALYGHEETRSFLYVDDAVDATIALAECEAASGEIVHVGSAREIAIADLACLAMRVAGLRGEIALHPAPPGSVRRRVPDVAKLRRLIGFTEKVSLEEGLARTASYYLRRDVAHPAFP